jgi:hypothetical protein
MADSKKEGKKPSNRLLGMKVLSWKNRYMCKTNSIFQFEIVHATIHGKRDARTIRKGA